MLTSKIVIVSLLLFSQIYSVANAKTNLFDTSNHPKSNGLSVTVSYPSQWRAEEVPKGKWMHQFHGKFNNTPVRLSLESKLIPNSNGKLEEDCKKMDSRDWGRFGGTFVEAFKISNKPIAIVKLSQPFPEQNKILIGLIGISCINNNMLLLNCETYIDSSNLDDANVKFDDVKKVCYNYFNSLKVKN